MLNTNVQISHFSLNGNRYYLYTNLYYVLSSTVPFIIPNLYSSCKLLYIDNVQIADNIKDQFGNVLYGNDVRGINKMEGFWRNSPVIGPYDENTMNTISSVADLSLLYNSNSDWNALNIPYLECDQSEPEPNEDPGTYELFNCFIDYEESILTAGGGVLMLNGIIDVIGECFESGGIGSELGSIPHDSSLNHLWPLGLKAIQIFRVDSIHSISSVITPNLFADTSTFNIYNFNLPRGLYLFNLILYNNKILPLYIEAKQSITSSYNQSDLLNALVYPVPTVENYFNIRFNSPISLKFSYELYSPYGLTLYQENYSIEGGIESNFHIRPTHGILPNGLLGHVLKFPDGSIKSFTTIKISN